MTGKPRIENSDRGITLSKPIAWSAFAFIVTIAIAGVKSAITYGGQMAEITSTVESVQKAQEKADAKADRIHDNHSIRVRSLETSAARDDARIGAISDDISQIQTQVVENNRLLRQIVGQGKN